MAITRRDTLNFVFENSNGRRYNLRFNADTGEGVARILSQVNGNNVRDDLAYDNTETTVDVDSNELDNWKGFHVSRKCYAAVYNTDKDLDTILDDS